MYILSCNLHGCLKLSLCIYLVFDFLVLSGIFTVDVTFFTHDNVATLVHAPASTLIKEIV